MQAGRLARWAGHRAWRDRLVLVLHLAYVFVPLGFFLVGLASFGKIPLSAGIHAWTGGAMGTHDVGDHVACQPRTHRSSARRDRRDPVPLSDGHPGSRGTYLRCAPTRMECPLAGRGCRVLGCSLSRLHGNLLDHSHSPEDFSRKKLKLRAGRRDDNGTPIRMGAGDMTPRRDFKKSQRSAIALLSALALWLQVIVPARLVLAVGHHNGNHVRFDHNGRQKDHRSDSPSGEHGHLGLCCIIGGGKLAPPPTVAEIPKRRFGIGRVNHWQDRADLQVARQSLLPVAARAPPRVS